MPTSTDKLRDVQQIVYHAGYRFVLLQSRPDSVAHICWIAGSMTICQSHRRWGIPIRDDALEANGDRLVCISCLRALQREREKRIERAKQRS